MLIADPKGGLYAGLAVEIFLLGFALFALIVGVPAAGLLLLAGLLWGGLIFLWFAFRVRLTADERGLRGIIGLSEIDLEWKEIRSMLPMPGGALFSLTDGTKQTIRLPNADFKRLSFWHQGGVERIIEVPPPRYPIPRGIETYLALHKSPTELLMVNVMVGGANLEDVAQASRTLAVRAADENRWDASFTGRIKILVSALRTPISPALNPLMEAALEGARADLKAKGWTVVGGIPFELSWEVMGKS